MKKEYRVWEAGSVQGHYVIETSPKRAACSLVSSTTHFPIHVLLWKSGEDLSDFKLTAGAKKFRDSKARDKYSRFGTKYDKKDLTSVWQKYLNEQYRSDMRKLERRMGT